MSELPEGLVPRLDLRIGESSQAIEREVLDVAVGETVTTRGSLQIPGAPTPDVYIAALGPQMLRLAGRRTAHGHGNGHRKAGVT